MANNKNYFSNGLAISVVIANMIGTGVFTSLGFQLLDIDAAPAIIMLWLLGGLLAFCGALCYGELGAALPRSGGEYNFLSRIYHPAAGFVSGWVSITVGFAAPTALVAMTAGLYVAAVFPSVPAQVIALGLVLAATIAHLMSRRASEGFQLLFTSFKVGLILIFLVAAWFAVPSLQEIRWQPQLNDVGMLTTAGAAVALIYVNYAYTGWNAATYLAGELQEPRRSLPMILIVGTGVVTLLYVVLHIMFLSVAPMDAIRGQEEVGYIVATHAFGETGAALVGITLGVLLISTVSAMLVAGPRALQAVGQDFRVLGVLARENRHGLPYIAIALQGGVTAILIVSATFEAVLLFAGFVLGLNTLFAVCGVVVLRWRQPELERPFRVPWYPLPVIIYAGITLWALIYTAQVRPVEVLFAAGLVGSGWLFYWLSRDRVAPDSEHSLNEGNS